MRGSGVFLVFLVGCDVPGITDQGGVTEDDLLTQVTEDLEYYTEWGQADEIEGVLPDVSGFHGPYIQVWYNTNGLESLYVAADGAAAVKESYEDAYGQTLNGLTAMRYSVDYGWFYAEVDLATGDFEETGRVDECIACHENAEEGSFGFLAPLVHE
jgi:hypothetical protein